ncbi:MAG: alanine racemase [Lentisphaerae bacterium]|nr:alanine racemase [Lentisphaerota bacterium]
MVVAMHVIRIEVSAGALRHNLKLLREGLAENAKLCAVVKADAYGHGAAMLWPVLAEGAEWLAVASVEEALQLREAGYTGPLLALFGVHVLPDVQARTEWVGALIRRGVTFTVTRPADVPILEAAARAAGQAADVHMEIDTGMTRSGVPMAQAPALAAALRGGRGVRLRGAFTHFAMAAEPERDFTAEQFRRFCKALTDSGLDNGVLRHCANSVATIEWPEMHLDMVRPGLAVYGYAPAPNLERTVALRPALRVISRLMQVRDVPAGARVGYGGEYTFPRPGRAGLVPIGYGDGYLRSLSNRGAVVGVRGRHARVLGRVSMDQISVDLTEVPGAADGDAVEVISNQPAAPHSVGNLARLAGTISYEVVCRLAVHRAERVLVE